MADQLPDDEIRGMAIAGWAMVMAVFSALEGRGVFTDAQMDGILEVALGALEYLPVPNDPALRKARILVERLAHSRARGRSP